MGVKKSLYADVTSLNPEVTGSCHQVSVHYPDGRRTMFLVDCGLFQEKGYNHKNGEPFPFKCENIEFVLVTHAHADHIGRIPMLYRDGYNGLVYATPGTGRLMKPSLRNSYQIMKEDAKRHKEKVLYEEDDLELALASIEYCKYEQVQYVHPNIKVTFFNNGHLVGAAVIFVQISYPGEKDINLFFTGDYKAENKFFEVKELPSFLYNLPMTVITESTYGYMDACEIKYHMESDIIKALKSGKTLLISVFALERAQSILFMLKSLQDRGEIRTDIPIGLDGGLAQDYTRMFLNSNLGLDPTKLDFLPESFEFIGKENREMVVRRNRQQIILTTSGMLDHGPAQFYLPSFVERKDVIIYIPGYCAENTLGYKIQHPEDGLIILDKKERNVRATVMTTNELSSHAKADELLELLNRFTKLNLVLVNHGATDSKLQFAWRVEEEVKTKQVEILGEHTFRVSAYGYVKHMKSKLSPTSVRKEAKKEEKDQKPKKKKQPKLKRVRVQRCRYCLR